MKLYLSNTILQKKNICESLIRVVNQTVKLCEHTFLFQIVHTQIKVANIWADAAYNTCLGRWDTVV